MRNREVRLLSVFGAIVFCVSLAVGEIYLREVWGFCDSVLMQADPDFEYIAQPDQVRSPFKKRIVYNNYSQRSAPVDSTAFIILGLGDSVINGGTLTDHDSLATTLLSQNLKIDNSSVQVLNISAGSWGPDNCMAYLERYGTFGASIAFLICSSHDVSDIMDFKTVVDVRSSISSEQYCSAWIELFDRYMWSRLKDNIIVFLYHQKVKRISEIHKSGIGFNPGFEKLATYFKERKIPFLILLHAEVSEQKRGCYNEEGEAIISFCKDHGITFKTDLGVFTDSDYRDNIHLNEAGQHHLYEVMKDYLLAVADTASYSKVYF